MKAQVYVLVAILAISLCAPVLLQASSLQSSQSRLRVVVLSIDAARFDHLVKLAGEGALPNIAKMLKEGIYADMVVVYPTATAVSHAAISTGAPPGVNGITGNAIHLPGTPITATVSGFNGSYLVSEPIWMAADRQGLKSIVVSFPQSTPPAWSTKKSLLFNIYDASFAFTYSTLYTTNKSVPRATYIELREAVNWTGVSEVLGSVARALESNITIGDTVFYLYLADLEGDGLYDRLVIAPTKDLRKAYAVLREGEWSKPVNTTVTYRGSTYTIAPLFKALRLNPVSDFRLYRGTTRPLEAPWFSNETVARDVWNNVVVKTGTFTDGDYYGLVNKWFDEETYMETVAYTNLFFKEFTLYVLKNYDWDLLMSYTPVIDNVYHQFLGLTDPRMPYYNPEKAGYYWELIVRTYKLVDDFVGALLENLPRDSVLIVLSDHGQYSVKKIVYVNGILYNNGFITDTVTKAQMVWHGHVFVNLKGREAGGVVPPEEYEGVVKNITNLLRFYRDPETGEYVFDIVVTRNESAAIGLGGERTGDIVLAVKPGYTTSTALVKDPATGRAIEVAPAVPLSTVTGDHGPVLPHYPELRAVFLAYGPGVRGGYLGAVSSLQVAPTIARLLGIEPPRDAKMPPAFTILEVTTTATLVKTTTATTTATLTATTTLRETTTLTTTATFRETYTSTATIVRTETTVTTTTATTTEKVVDVGVTAAAAIAALAVGAVAGLLVRRK